MKNKILPHEHDASHDLANLETALFQVSRFETVADIFKQLSDTTRIRIFWLLCHTEQCVINISALLDMSSPAVSHHLRALRSCDLIVSRREGKEVYYKAADNSQARLLHKTIEQVTWGNDRAISRYWDHIFFRIRSRQFSILP